MKKFIDFGWLAVLAGFFYTIFLEICQTQNLYPIHQPAKPGQYWRLEWVYDEGTPIESRTIDYVRFDSIADGYIIRASEANGRFGIDSNYTSGTTVRNLLPDQGWYWPTPIGAPDRGWQISKEEWEAHTK